MQELNYIYKVTRDLVEEGNLKSQYYDAPINYKDWLHPAQFPSIKDVVES